MAAALLAAGVAATVWVGKPWARPIPFEPPAPSGIRVDTKEVFGHYYPAGQRAPGVLLLGGSEGGVGRRVVERAVDLQAQGFSVLLMAYFGGPRQPRTLERVPLEAFDAALGWMRAQREVDAERIGIVGHSKGAEVALLVATRHPELRAIVAGAPSSVVWRGIDAEWPINPEGSWTVDGRELPSLGYSVFLPWRTLRSTYDAGLRGLNAHRDALIEIERASTPVLLVCGEADDVWPSCRMSRMLQSRARARGGPEVDLLTYEDAGHSAFGPPLSRRDPRLTERFAGGTAEGNYRARREGWPKVVAFLREHLG